MEIHLGQIFMETIHTDKRTSSLHFKYEEKKKKDFRSVYGN